MRSEGIIAHDMQADIHKKVAQIRAYYLLASFVCTACWQQIRSHDLNTLQRGHIDSVNKAFACPNALGQEVDRYCEWEANK